MSSTKEEDSAPSDVVGADNNCKHTNGSESSPPTPPPPPRPATAASRDDDECRDQRTSPKESGGSLNGSHHRQNDSNNNTQKPSDEKSTRSNQEQQDPRGEDDEEPSPSKATATEETSPGKGHQRTSLERSAVKKEHESMDVESSSVVVRPKPTLDEIDPKASSFAAEFINNIRNSRNLLGNSHNELADEIAGKNKEVSVKDRFQGWTTLVIYIWLVQIESACGHRV